MRTHSTHWANSADAAASYLVDIVAKSAVARGFAAHAGNGPFVAAD